MMIVPTAIDSAHLAVRAPSFDMHPLLFIEEESLVLVMTPNNEAILSLVSNLVTSRMYDEWSGSRSNRINMIILLF